jgi:hypothetical protein
MSAFIVSGLGTSIGFVGVVTGGVSGVIAIFWK